MRQIIKVPVYYYEDDKGYELIDEEGMIEEFFRQIRILHCSTKAGRKEWLHQKRTVGATNHYHEELTKPNKHHGKGNEK